jgi:hypothetical protein
MLRKKLNICKEKDRKLSGCQFLLARQEGTLSGCRAVSACPECFRGGRIIMVVGLSASLVLKNILPSKKHLYAKNIILQAVGYLSVCYGIILKDSSTFFKAPKI